MSNFKLFMKDNKETKENTKYVATKTLKDENGLPLEWEIRPLSTKEFDAIREDCTRDVPVRGKKGLYRQSFNSSMYMSKLICASVVDPNLSAVELQNSYGVMTPEDLIKEMLGPSEYTEFSAFIQEFNGFTDIEEDVEKAKN